MTDTLRPWRIATRLSALARAQAGQVADALTTLTGRPSELVPMSTTGDDNPDRAIESFDVKGLFVDKTREAVLRGDCDLVVHSYKDLPTDPALGLVIGAIPRRVDPRDALVTRGGIRLADLSRSQPATIGTSSARRRAQVMKARRDVIIQPLRGNLDTRIRRVRDGDLDGVIVAFAGLLRLGPELGELGVVPLEHGECLHAPAQGALALECRGDDRDTLDAIAPLDHAATKLAVAAERFLLMALEGGCTAPIGAHAHEVPGPDGQPRLELLGMYSDPNGTRLARASHQAAVSEPELLGTALAKTLREQVEG